MGIENTKNKTSKKIWNREYVPKIDANIQLQAYRKMQMIHAAVKLDDLRVPPGNRLEALKGNRNGQYSIRVNKQWRICFAWYDGNAYNVEFCDYHD